MGERKKSADCWKRIWLDEIIRGGGFGRRVWIVVDGEVVEETGAIFKNSGRGFCFYVWMLFTLDLF